MTDDRTAELSDLLMRVARAQRRRWREALAPWQLAPSHSRALRVVGLREGVRLSDLAEALHIAPRSATEVVDALEERGLATRRPDPGDRRAVQVVPTPAGRRLLQEVDAARASDAQELFGRLAPGDRTELARLLRVLVDEPPVDPPGGECGAAPPD